MSVNNNPSSQNISGVKGRPATPEEIALRDGYVQGRTDENYVQQAVRGQERVQLQRRADAEASNGVLVGMLIALLAAGVGAVLYFLTGDRTNIVPVAVPQVEREINTEKETTIIEREVSVPEVSVPEVSLPDVQIDVPDVNITNEAPEPAAASPTEPATEPAIESDVEALAEPDAAVEAGAAE